MTVVTEKFLVPPKRSEQLVNAAGVAESRFINYLEDLTTTVEAINSDIINLAGTTQIVVTGTYQTSGNTIVICDGIAVITLEPTPTDGTFVTVKRTNGQVTVKSDVVTIDGNAQDILTRDGTSIDFVYLTETTTWYKV